MELYVHLPFCKSKCKYCDFASWAGCEEQIPGYIDALLKEARFQSAFLHHPDVETVFIGGGTPSVVPAMEIKRLLNELHQYFSILPQAEFTIEANPGTLTQEWIDAATHGGMNRLSLGMQAYQPQLLKLLGRIHMHDQVLQSVSLAKNAGITNINLDLMFGLPTQTLDMWHDTIENALALSPTHLSCYGLIPEEGTPMLTMLENGTLSLPDEALERQMYDDCIVLLRSHGYEQYEISNFSIPGYQCRHNLGYWRQVPYLGLGASSASMLYSAESDVNTAYVRTTNPRTIHDYISMVDGQAWNQREKEAVSRTEAQFETMMLGLRTNAGVSETAFRKMHSISLNERYGSILRQLQSEGLVCFDGDNWKLTRYGMDIQNTVLVQLMDD